LINTPEIGMIRDPEIIAVGKGTMSLGRARKNNINRISQKINAMTRGDPHNPTITNLNPSIIPNPSTPTPPSNKTSTSKTCP
jgi:hypothetical protein